MDHAFIVIAMMDHFVLFFYNAFVDAFSKDLCRVTRVDNSADGKWLNLSTIKMWDTLTKRICTDLDRQEELYCEAATDIIPLFRMTDAATMQWFRPARHHDRTLKEPGYKMVQKSPYCFNE